MLHEETAAVVVEGRRLVGFLVCEEAGATEVGVACLRVFMGRPDLFALSVVHPLPIYHSPRFCMDFDTCVPM